MISSLTILLLSQPNVAALDGKQMNEVLATIDDRQRNSGDYKTVMFMEQKRRDKSDLVFEAVVYRRDADDKLMILFSKPRAEAGKGYLRLNKNLFMYDPTVGKWERRTERERIGGTNSQRADFDESRLAEEFSPAYVAEEKLGKFAVHHLRLTAKAGIDVAYPIVDIWIDRKTSNVLKRQERALSGKLMRTSYTPKWRRVYSETKKAHVYMPKEIRIFDEIEEGNRTLIVLRQVDMRALEQNIFTKAWFESQSR